MAMRRAVARMLPTTRGFALTSSVRANSGPGQFTMSKVPEVAAAAAGENIIQIARYNHAKKEFEFDTYAYKKGPYMVLDLLIAIKSHQDPTLTFRNSCGEGVCGSCAMNINGANTISCVTPAPDYCIVYPLPNMPILRDLVVDFRWFFKQIESVQNYAPKENKELFNIDGIKARYLEIVKKNKKNAPKVELSDSTSAGGKQLESGFPTGIGAQGQHQPSEQKGKPSQADPHTQTLKSEEKKH